MLKAKEIDMTKGNPSSLLLQFLLPLVLGNIFQQFYNMADTIIVGHYVGVKALAAVGATGNIMFLIFGFVTGLLQGFAVITSQRFGAGDVRGVKKSVGNALVLSLIITVIFTIGSCLAMDFMLSVMNTPQDVYDMSKTYIITICYGTCCNVLYNLMASLLRAVGNSKIPLYFLIVSAGLNILLDIVFIANFNMGVLGAALATLISQGISGVLCIAYTWKKVEILVPSTSDLHLDHQCVKNQLQMGIPMALQFSITAIGTIMVQSALNLLGTVAMASYTVACKIEQLFTQFFSAMGMTCATYSGQNVGSGKIKRINLGVRYALLYCLIYALLIYAILFNTCPFFVKLFVESKESAESIVVITGYVKEYIHLCGLMFFPLGMIFVFRNILQGSGYSFWPMMGGVVELICRAIAANFAVRSNNFTSICYANASTWLVTGLFLFGCYLAIMPKLYRRFGIDKKK